MLSKILHYTISFLLFAASVHAQEILSLSYFDSVVIPYGSDINGNIIGGISGITFNSNDSAFYLVADKPPSRIFKTLINSDERVEVDIVETLTLSPSLLSNSELEGIAHNYETDKFYVSDEQKSGTRILELNNKASFLRIIEPLNQSFIPLSGHNSGIEGLTISNDLADLYYAFERPTDACLKQALVMITKITFANRTSHTTFYYQFHNVANDKINTNGISDILFLSDTSLLVMERAFIPGQGNVVRLYKANLISGAGQGKAINCNNDSIIPLRSELLFDFVKVSGFKVDNAEGMAFNADKSMLYVVTDNNFSRKQETQIIALKVNRNKKP